MSLSWDKMSLQMKRKLLFTPCETKEALQNWIRQFLGYDLPDCTVDPSSNSSPMALVWEIYEKALKNDDPDFSTVLAYASRESMKTLVTAVLVLATGEILACYSKTYPAARHAPTHEQTPRHDPAAAFALCASASRAEAKRRREDRRDTRSLPVRPRRGHHVIPRRSTQSPQSTQRNYWRMISAIAAVSAFYSVISVSRA